MMMRIEYPSGDSEEFKGSIEDILNKLKPDLETFEQFCTNKILTLKITFMCD